MTTSGKTATSRAFTLIEMLTVLLILSILLSIIIPAINSARTSARRADTTALLSGLEKSCLSFQNDEKRLPGYFTAFDMGSNINGSQVGFTGMENIMLDLIGGITTEALTPGLVVEAGPFAANDPKNVHVNLTQMGGSRQDVKGSTQKAYFQFDSKRFFAQNGTAPAGTRMAGGSSNLNALPVLVDTFGSPILAWQQDDAPAAADTFARETAAAGANGRARFYWASNAGFTNSATLGKLAENQNDANSGSLLSTGGATATSRNTTLTGLLGSPSAPSSITLGQPASARAPIVLQSAGQKGVYLGKTERGGKVAGANGVAWTLNQDPITGGAFDDIIQAVGN